MTKVSKVRTMVGTVVKKSGDKTVAVTVVSRHQHLKYGKTIETVKKYLAHDPRNSVMPGQKVTIRETRPLSARKRWTIVYDS